ncbi:MAG: hypothetical protein ACYTG7_16300 [Planctomycetota bacterium]|jgi:hypothetical protein
MKRFIVLLSLLALVFGGAALTATAGDGGRATHTAFVENGTATW